VVVNAGKFGMKGKSSKSK